MISSSQREELLRLAEKATKAAPGSWEEEGKIGRDTGSDYRDSYVVFDKGTVVDTFNAWCGFDEEDRAALGRYIAACDPQTIIALLTPAAPSREEIAREIMLKVQGCELGHWEEEHNLTGSARERVFVTSPAEISLLERVSNEAADAILALFHKAPTAENTDG